MFGRRRPVSRLTESIASRSILARARRNGWRIETQEVDGKVVYYRVYPDNKSFYKIYTA